MVLTRTEDLSWACPSAVPDGHGLVEADFLRIKEYGSRVVIICLYRLDNFPKLIDIGWGVSFIEPRFTSDGVKAAFRNKIPKAIRAWIFLLIKWGDIPKILPLPYRSGGD